MQRLRKAFSSMRDHTAGDSSALQNIIIKATSSQDLPFPDKCVLDILKIFSTSPTMYRSFTLTFTRRFSNTHCWRVALKCLVLLHRILRSLPDNIAFKNELQWARSAGLLSLSPCHFRDLSSPDSKNYTSFIRSYAQLLHESLDYMYGSNEVKEFDPMLETLPQLQNLIDRAMDCRPTGATARSFLVQLAMKQIIRDSFVCYTSFRKELIVVLDGLLQMPCESCIAAFGIYKRAATQGSHLNEFYEWSKSTGLCGLYEYPYIDRIPHIHIRALETFLDRMWESRESSPSTTSESPASSSEENDNSAWAKIESGNKVTEEIEPLIQLDDDNDWETLLEDSISFTPTRSKIDSLDDNKLQLQITEHRNGYFPSSPLYPWGL